MYENGWMHSMYVLSMYVCKYGWMDGQMYVCMNELCTPTDKGGLNRESKRQQGSTAAAAERNAIKKIRRKSDTPHIHGENEKKKKKKKLEKK